MREGIFDSWWVSLSLGPGFVFQPRAMGHRGGALGFHTE